MGQIDFCDNTTVEEIFSAKNFEGLESKVSLYKIFVPILLVGCVLSLMLNAVLVAVGNFLRNPLRPRSPILILSLNLAATDAMASLLNGTGLMLNSYLPEVLSIKIGGNRSNCISLVLEILRLSSLISSAMHLLALALVHYKGIVNPLHYRSVIFCSQHRTRSIHLMSFICWFLPTVVFASYFTSIPCQGFQTSNCRVEFILTFRFRLMVVFAFFVPLILMSFLYIRIFTIIKRHQAQRSGWPHSSTLRHHRPSQHHSIHQSRHSPSLKASSPPLAAKLENPTEPIGEFSAMSIRSGKRCSNLMISNESSEEFQESQTPNDDQLSRFRPSSPLHYNSLVTNQTEQQTPKTMLCKSEPDLDNQNKSPKYTVLHRVLILFGCQCCVKWQFSSHCQPSISNSTSSAYSSEHVTNFRNNRCIDKSKCSIKHRNPDSNIVQPKESVRLGNTGTVSYQSVCNSSINANSAIADPQVSCSSGHAKALITTLLILGTYVLCWMPAVLYFALTCVDSCPFPITYVNIRSRVIFSFVANGLVILKAIVDPFIYTYRMKEMKTALNKCFAVFCPSSVVNKLCPIPRDNRPASTSNRSNSTTIASSTFLSNHHNHQHNNNNPNGVNQNSFLLRQNYRQYSRTDKNRLSSSSVRLGASSHQTAVVEQQQHLVQRTIPGVRSSSTGPLSIGVDSPPQQQSRQLSSNNQPSISIDNNNSIRLHNKEFEQN